MRQEGPFKIEISKPAERDIRKLDKNIFPRIARGIDMIALNPFFGKKLQGDLVGLYRFKVWPYRILYEIDFERHFVVVTRVQHRKDIYR